MERLSKSQRDEIRKERGEIETTRRTRRRLNRIAIRTAMLILAGIGLLATAYVLLAYAAPGIQNTALVAAVAVVSVFSASVIILRQFQESLRECLEDFRDVNEEHKTAIATQLREGLASARTPLPSMDDVAQSAAGLLRDFRLSLDKKPGCKLVYLGATANILSAPDDSEDAQSPFSVYHDEQSQLIQKEAFIERYIALLPKSSFLERGEKFRRAYLSWIAKEISLLRTNPNYWFFNVPRAYRWGGMTSHIFGPDTSIEILGGSQGGAVMKGEAAVRQYLNQLLAHIKQGETAKLRMSADDLRKYRDDLVEENRPKALRSGASR